MVGSFFAFLKRYRITKRLTLTALIITTLVVVLFMFPGISSFAKFVERDSTGIKLAKLTGRAGSSSLRPDPAPPTPKKAHDLVAPETVITKAPPKSIEDEAAAVSVRWTGTDNKTPAKALTYSYSLEGKDTAWSTYSRIDGSKYELARGKYVFKVTARDRAGNVDPTPAQVSFTVGDFTPPSIPGGLVVYAGNLVMSR